MVETARFSLKIRRLRGLLRELRAASAPEEVSLALLRRVHLAWGNVGWSPDPGFLHDVAARVGTARGNILDCGSGISTIVCAAAAARHGGVVYSLEQDEAWARHMDGVIQRLGIDNVILWHAPLRSYGDFVWYDLVGRSLPPAFACVSCDGPSVTRQPWSPDEHGNCPSGLCWSSMK